MDKKKISKKEPFQMRLVTDAFRRDNPWMVKHKGPTFIGKIRDRESCFYRRLGGPLHPLPQ